MKGEIVVYDIKGIVYGITVSVYLSEITDLLLCFTIYQGSGYN